MKRNFLQVSRFNRLPFPRVTGEKAAATVAVTDQQNKVKAVETVDNSYYLRQTPEGNQNIF